jgi:hypothetical protein
MQLWTSTLYFTEFYASVWRNILGSGMQLWTSTLYFTEFYASVWRNIGFRNAIVNFYFILYWILRFCMKEYIGFRNAIVNFYFILYWILRFCMKEYRVQECYCELLLYIGRTESVRYSLFYKLTTYLHFVMSSCHVIGVLPPVLPIWTIFARIQIRLFQTPGPN